ncbi:MAG: quinone-dependent dihydroorotate dehydrogenase [Gammaproteobacteria bacterium]|nr:quinone-dependent dihydroorotate dehydrogenase [Gammaproteobacteria bacterium]
MSYRHLRRLLFLLPPEAAHRLALWGLRAWGSIASEASFPSAGEGLGAPVQAMGLSFPNRVGLAAGLDKDAVAVRGLARLGFGFVEVGTVTPLPQSGNPKPRLFRSVPDAALINRMGFNSAGLDAMTRRLARLRKRPLRPMLGVNIGKNRDTPLDRAVDDYHACLTAVAPFADYVTVNLSSPNTPGLRRLQAASSAAELLGRLDDARSATEEHRDQRLPLAVKVAPDLGEQELREVADVLRQTNMDAVIAGNTTLSRPMSLASGFAREEGGLSGAPLAPLARQTVATLRASVPANFPVIGVGGIASHEDAEAMLDAGADLVQIYTGFVFRGPQLVRQLTPT